MSPLTESRHTQLLLKNRPNISHPAATEGVETRDEADEVIMALRLDGGSRKEDTTAKR